MLIMAIVTRINEQEYRELALNDPDRLWELWDGVPRPLVVEIWSPSTGAYDFETKLQGYGERGEAEIWFIHPYERTLTAWRQQPDGKYVEEICRGGAVPVTSLPGVVVDLDALPDG